MNDPLHRSCSPRRGFTLLEVVIALAILAMALYVLIDTQALAVMETADSRKILTGTYLAQQKMTDALLRLEGEGFTTADVEEEGDFKSFAEDQGLEGSTNFGDSFDEYQWAFAIRKVDIQLGDVSGASEQLSAAGIGPSQDQQQATADRTGTDPSASPDLSDMGVQPDMITDMLRPYIREVRVMVWWGAEAPDPDKPCEDCVELVTHVCNPSGTESLAGELPAGGG